MRPTRLARLALALTVASPTLQSARGGSGSLGLDEYVPVPESNPLTAAKIALGGKLFVDSLLSVDRSVACSSCHRPSHKFSDTLRFSRGIFRRETTRNTPSLLNRAYGATFFWDGRSASLEEAVMQPIENPREMGLPLPRLVARLRQRSDYRRAFALAFHESPTATNVARSLASYVRSLRSGNAAVDRFFHRDRAALSVGAARGMDVFFGKANCTVCHAGPTFTDERFHNTGVSNDDAPSRASVTGRRDDEGRFKVPSLRNVALTGPYMHDGSLATLEAVVEFYNRGGGPNPRLDPDIHPLGLSTEDKRALVEFLRSLTSRD